MSEPKFHRYDTREALAEALAGGIAAVLGGAIATRGVAMLAVSGGSTPKLLFERLSQTDIDWHDVTITLVDERWVPETHERSNGGLLRTHLLKDKAAAAQFLPLFVEADTPDDAKDDLHDRFRRVTRPFDVVVLGMGNDGHTASFFPGADALDAAIDPEGQEPVVAISAPGAGEPRVTLALPMLIDARFLALHIEGEDKLATYDRAREVGPVVDMPVRCVLRADRAEPLTVFWAP